MGTVARAKFEVTARHNTDGPARVTQDIPVYIEAHQVVIKLVTAAFVHFEARPAVTGNDVTGLGLPGQADIVIVGGGALAAPIPSPSRHDT